MDNLVFKWSSKDSKNEINGAENNNDDSNWKVSLVNSLIVQGSKNFESIFIEKYQHLRYLEISDNDIKILDLTNLPHLEILKCNANNMMKLILNGKHLTSLMVENNCLNTISFSENPESLRVLNISYNAFERLPLWISNCSKIRTIQAQHNLLSSFVDVFLNCPTESLQILNLSSNKIQEFPILPKCFDSLEEIYLHKNDIQVMPENFFNICYKKLKILNISCNKLNKLPDFVLANEILKLEQLFLSFNNLTNSLFTVLQKAANLKVFFAAFNLITEIPAKCLQVWTDLQMLVLSGNMIRAIPKDIETLKKLSVFKVNSNHIAKLPSLNSLDNLIEIDCSHNQLGEVNLLYIIPPNLKYLDLSCNANLNIDSKVSNCQPASNKWRLVDVTGRNRAALPTVEGSVPSGENIPKTIWIVGFSETLGNSKRMLVKQFRLEQFRLNEALFGMYESSECCEAASKFVKFFPLIYQDSLSNKKTSIRNLKSSFLTTQRYVTKEMKDSALVCHITEDTCSAAPTKVTSKPISIRAISCGTVGLFLIKKNNSVVFVNSAVNVTNVVEKPKEPFVHDIKLCNEDEFLVICNEKLYKTVDVATMALQIKKEENCILAAKRVQIVAQSLGALENLSIIIIKIDNRGRHINRLVQEFRCSLKNKKVFCHCSLQNLDYNLNILHHNPAKAGRSSPSGQSDTSPKDKHSLETLETQAVTKKEKIIEPMDKKYNDTDSLLSEEQFKSWEYILEQNTQLLFDKELDTLSATLPQKYEGLNKSPNQFYSVGKNLTTNRKKDQELTGDEINSAKPFYEEGSVKRFNIYSPAIKPSNANFNIPVRHVVRPNSAYFGAYQDTLSKEIENYSISRYRLDNFEYNINVREKAMRLQKFCGETSTEL